jgi:ADP-ribose pyrophosphatase YjhB (NUDIX family)
MREGLDGPVMFPGGRVEAEQEPLKAALKYLRRQTGLEGAHGFSVHVHGKPMEDSHVVTLFFVVPVSIEAKPTGFPSMETKFHNLSDVLENPNGSYEWINGQQGMLFALDHWLKGRHAIPFVNLDMMFSLRARQGYGGRVLALIENPVFEAQVNPPENDLLVALNNPMFETADRTSTSLQL